MMYIGRQQIKGNYMSEDFLNNYKDFVEEVTSDASDDFQVFIERMYELKKDGGEINLPLLMTAGIGMADEGGEFLGIIKKIFFHGKPLDDANKAHLKSELGDVAWYWINGCRALGVDPYEVMADNVKKLEARYPGGSFDVYHSENRKEGDI